MKIESYKQGSPCWIELGTPSQESSKKFYVALFGWNYFDVEMEPGVPSSPVYSNAKKGDEFVGAMYPHHEEVVASGMPAIWSITFSVDDIEKSTERVVELGGSVNLGPMDIFDLGRMSSVADPNGAPISLWEAGQHIGAGRMFEHGTFTWGQLTTRNRPASTKFLSQLLGFGLDSGPGPDGGHNDVLMSGDEPMVGITEMPVETAASGTPNHWVVYFHVDDVDASVELAVANGGTVIMEPNQLAHIGRIAVASDPQGAVFGMVTPTEHGHEH